MNIIVTGGAGFIGSNFIFYTLEHRPEHRVVCLDKLTYSGNKATLAKVWDDPRFAFSHTDICDRAAVFALFERERPDAVINFAAETHVDRSIADPSAFLETNVKGTAVLMDACLEYRVRRFHQVGTDEVYGDLPADRFDLSFSEDSPLKPSSPYSATKASADMLALAYCRTYGLNATVSRCSNNYGPYQFPEKLIPLTVVRALENNSVPVYGNGGNVRDWLHVQDHCAALDTILHRGAAGEVYNVGGACERRNIDLVRRILDILGRPESLISFVEDRKGHDRRYAVDSSKLRRELSWNPATNFDTGLEATVKWYADNSAWLRAAIGGSTL